MYVCMHAYMHAYMHTCTRAWVAVKEANQVEDLCTAAGEALLEIAQHDALVAALDAPAARLG